MSAPRELPRSWQSTHGTHHGIHGAPPLVCYWSVGHRVASAAMRGTTDSTVRRLAYGRSRDGGRKGGGKNTTATTRPVSARCKETKFPTGTFRLTAVAQLRNQPAFQTKQERLLSSSPDTTPTVARRTTNEASSTIKSVGRFGTVTAQAHPHEGGNRTGCRRQSIGGRIAVECETCADEEPCKDREPSADREPSTSGKRSSAAKRRDAVQCGGLEKTAGRGGRHRSAGVQVGATGGDRASRGEASPETRSIKPFAGHHRGAAWSRAYRHARSELVPEKIASSGRDSEFRT